MKRLNVVLLLVFLLTLAVAQRVSHAQDKAAAPDKKPMTQKPPEAAPSDIGKKDSSKWTDTTTAAAGTPEQKAVLGGGKVMSVTGELVELSCYLQLGKRGEKHIPCGTDCLKNGQPFAVLTAKNELYLVLAEEHDPRRYGKADLREAMVPLLAKQVRVTGMHTMSHGYHAIYVQAFELPGGKK